MMNNRHAGTGWANTEFRSYTFDPSTCGGSGNGNASLVETPESLKRRAGTEKPLGKEEQKNLQRTAGLQKAKDVQATV